MDIVEVYVIVTTQMTIPSVMCPYTYVKYVHCGQDMGHQWEGDREVHTKC